MSEKGFREAFGYEVAHMIGAGREYDSKVREERKRQDAKWGVNMVDDRSMMVTFSCVAECPTPAVASFVAHTRTDVPALVARVRDLAAKLDASAQAFDALVADVWRATGETHEPPADVAALLARVEGQREALDGYRLAAVDVVERIDGERQEPDFDMPAEFGAYVCDEVDHLRAAVAAEAHAREAAVAVRAAAEAYDAANPFCVRCKALEAAR